MPKYKAAIRLFFRHTSAEKNAAETYRTSDVEFREYRPEGKESDFGSGTTFDILCQTIGHMPCRMPTQC